MIGTKTGELIDNLIGATAVLTRDKCPPLNLRAMNTDPGTSSYPISTIWAHQLALLPCSSWPALAITSPINGASPTPLCLPSPAPLCSPSPAPLCPLNTHQPAPSWVLVDTSAKHSEFIGWHLHHPKFARPLMLSPGPPSTLTGTSTNHWHLHHPLPGKLVGTSTTPTTLPPMTPLLCKASIELWSWVSLYHSWLVLPCNLLLVTLWLCWYSPPPLHYIVCSLCAHLPVLSCVPPTTAQYVCVWVLRCQS